VAILLLGGYGNTGRLIAELLLQHTAETVIVAGRSGEKAEEAAGRLRRRFPAERVRSVRADAADATTLRSALQGASMVVVASSTSEHTGTLARAAMDGEVDYIDLAVSRSKIETL
jgi:saccharopine dehydrogenase-like NADP-dependent oxidoreductase